MAISNTPEELDAARARIEAGEDYDAVITELAQIAVDREEREKQKMRVAAGPKVKFKFNSTNRDALLWAKKHAAELIEDISEVSRKRIRSAIAGLTEGADWNKAVDVITKAVGDEERAEIIAHHECLPGETVVDAAVIKAVHRRWYEGNVAEIRTRNGRQFTATPNHPMLTNRGWIAAGQIQEDDYLVCDIGKKNVSVARDHDVAAPPTTLREIFDAASSIGVVERSRGVQLDFHGDGMNGNVDVACPFRPLMIGMFTPLYKPSADLIFSGSDQTRASFCDECKLLLPINETVCACAVRQIQRVGVGASDASGTNNVLNPVTISVDSLGDFSARHSGQIELDHVVSIRLRTFRGHVYNLSTPFGYFTLQGSDAQGQGIYTGNTMLAASEGQRQAWDQAVDKGLLTGKEKRTWIVTPDDKLCPDCEALEGTTAPLGGVYPGGYSGPPLHVRCRCTEGLI